jgi:hypothetical protein
VLGAAACVADHELLTGGLFRHIVELEPLATHEEQSNHIAKVQFLGRGLAVKALKALDEHIVIDRRAAMAIG